MTNSSKETIGGKIYVLLDRLPNHISKSMLLRMKMLVGDIANNRIRVNEIINRFNQADNDVKSRM